MWRVRLRLLSIVILCSPSLFCNSQYLIEPKEGDNFIARVSGGLPAKPGQVPYQVSFKQRAGDGLYQNFCGGVIIGPSKLLSAAHCFAADANICSRICNWKPRIRTLSRTMAVAGSLINKAYGPPRGENSESPQWRRLQNVKVPFDYRFPKNDIAIVFLRTPYIFNTIINFIPIASRHINYVGTCLLSGFGKISTYGPPSDVLLVANLKILGIRQCSRMHRRKMTKFLCSVDSVAASQKGDSGGPVACAGTGDPNERGRYGILTGIVSGGAVGVGSFYTRVSTFYGFVLRNHSHNVNPTSLLVVLIVISLIQGRYIINYRG